MMHQSATRTGGRALRRLGLSLGLGLLAAAGAQAQNAASYQFTASSVPFTPITGGTAIPSILADDNGSPIIPIGFNFLFEGVSYSNFYASSNCIIGLGTASTGSLSNNFPSGVGASNLPVFAPFWDDMHGGLGGATAQYVVTGAAPNRVLTMEWLNWGRFGGNANVLSLQAKLYETSGRIDFAYRQETNVQSFSATIGIQGASNTYESLTDDSAAPSITTAVSNDNIMVKPATNQLYSFAVPPVTWTGAMSTDWGTAGNWNNNAVPTSATNVSIPVTANQPVVTGAQTCANLSLSPSATLTLATNTTPATVLTTTGTVNLASTSTLVQQAATDLHVGQDLANAGATFTLNPTSTVSFGAATAITHNITGASTVPLQNLSIGQQTASEALAIQSPTTVQRLLTLAQTATVSISAGPGTLTLLSNATGTAQIVKDAASAVNGTVTVQRYITPTLNAGAGYRHYAAPTTNATTASLATTGFTPTLNTGYNTSPTPGTVTPFPTVFVYDQSRVGTVVSSYNAFDQGFFSPAAGGALANGLGFTVNIPASQTVAFTGPLANGTVSMTGLTRGANAQSGWQLLGNPFASVIDVDVVAANSTGMDAATYIFQSTGQYVGTYQSFVNGIGSGHFLASGQGFFRRVTTAGTPGAVNFTNAARLTTYANPTFQRTAAETRALVQLDLVNPATRQRDAAYVYFQAGATPGFDANFDAYKLPSGAFPYLAVTTPTETLAVSGLPLLSPADLLLPLAVTVPATGTYTLEGARVINLPAGKVAYLRDAQTGAVVDLGQQPAYSFTMNAAFAGPRFSLLITSNRVLAVAPASLAQQVALYPNPARGTVLVDLPAALRQQAIALTVVNALGQTVHTLTLPATGTAEARSLPLTGVAVGVYSVRLATGQGLVTKRLVVE